ncbi:MAG: hypothetical protein OK454_11125 [Thaumarchaeota archaeon]|nr:hypothetical protein [Nitrososphaerota archaeon]
MIRTNPPYLLAGLGFVMEGLISYFLVGGPVALAIGAGSLVLGVVFFFRGAMGLPGAYRSAVYLGMGLFFVIEGGNLLWDLGRTIANGSAGYWLPFMMVDMPWYLAGDLGIFFVGLGAILMFVAGLGFAGRNRTRRG